MHNEYPPEECPSLTVCEAPADHLVLLLWTAPDQEEAAQVATLLLEEKLIACATLLPGALSLYVWEGQLRSHSEVQVLFKTCQRQRSRIQQVIAKAGSYQNPELLALVVDWSASAYLNWVQHAVVKSNAD